MKLFHYPHAPYSRKVLLAAYEKGVDFESILSRPWEKEEKAALKAAHPLATVPLLVDGDEVFTESSIAVERLDQATQGGTRLIPADPREALRVRAWDKLGDSHLMGPTAYLAWSLRKTPETQNVEKIKAQRNTLEIALRLANEQLGKTTFLGGDALTMADLSPVSAISCLLSDKTIPGLDAWPNVARWYRDVTARPSFVRILEECKAVPLPAGF